MIMNKSSKQKSLLLPVIVTEKPQQGNVDKLWYSTV